MNAYLRLMRPADWLKNLLVFAALVFSRNLGQSGLVFRAVLAFFAFCLLSSGFYALNDALDADNDRRHPVKKRRPVASGQVAAPSAIRFGVILLAAGIAVAFALRMELGLIAGVYVLLQVTYNLRLKRVLTVDVVALALGFVLRAAAGAAAIHVQISMWLVMCVFFVCLYLGFIKRLADLASADANAGDPWRSPAGYRSREELGILLSTSGALMLASYLVYTLSAHAERLFGVRALGLSLLSPLALIAMHRFYRRASSGQSDRPLDAIVEDHVIQACVALFAAGVIVSLYAGGVDVWLDRLFIR